MTLKNLFARKRFKWTQEWIFDQYEWRCRNKTLKLFKSIYWVFQYYGCRLWKYWWLQPKQIKKNLNCVWWHDIMTNKKFQAIIKEFFIRCRKLNIPLTFTTQSYCFVPKDVRLSSKHYLIMKFNNKVLQWIILQILITKMLWRFTENAQNICILFDNWYNITSNWSPKT